MNITEFLEGQELTLYANKRLETSMDNINGKLKVLGKALLPAGFLVLLNNSMGESLFTSIFISLLSVIYFICALMFAEKKFRQLAKKEKLNLYELEDLAKETAKAQFIHENVPFNYKAVDRFEKTLLTVAKFRENVSCEFSELDTSNLILCENHKAFTNILFKDIDNNEEFLVGIALDASEKVIFYSEYPIIKGVIDLKGVEIKSVD